MNKTQKHSSFVESLSYSRDKCMLFHGMNFIAIGLTYLFFSIVLKEFSDQTYFIIFSATLPVMVLIMSFYFVSQHDLGLIETRMKKGEAIWRDHIEYRISKFAKFLFRVK